MAWVRIEDAVTEHRKHLRAGPSACWLWICGIAYCQRQLSDGFIPEEAIPMLGVLKGAKPLADRLVEVGLFDRAEGGYVVHDYHDYNDTREEAQQRRGDLSGKRAMAGRLGGLRSAEVRRVAAEANKQANTQQESEAKRSPFPSLPIPIEEKNVSRTASAKRVVDLWNLIVTPPITQVTKLTADRISKINARLKASPDLAAWRTVIAWINRQDWCRAPGTGEHPNWTASLDWLCKSDGTFQKWLERAEQASVPRQAHQEKRPRNCQHEPPCVDDATHTKRFMSEQKAS